MQQPCNQVQPGGRLHQDDILQIRFDPAWKKFQVVHHLTVLQSRYSMSFEQLVR
jgi:hypothetical protein